MKGKSGSGSEGAIKRTVFACLVCDLVFLVWDLVTLLGPVGTLDLVDLEGVGGGPTSGCVLLGCGSTVGSGFNSVGVEV